ncbi:Uncharacterized conserved protein, DUF2164 family [Cohaesibacter sp. ES.047]|uniref:DUF2164 domain-containing protein n=1 Tax=Cohaesibacter sp. ES.047 TaxID=1798205 RepID=UPI000BB8412D|nr:DUF2164 domain-containing protein [Cohaesibacter sp. ES.047]SNY91520.1 Uncharacterized conserved protein, DUF2164 family [Cohaesibacter sp. ES.047]
MAGIEFTHDEKTHLSQMLQAYFGKELDQDLGRFEAEFLLDHLARTLGPVFYNKGLLDARALLDKQMDEFTDALYAMEMPLDGA